jgi:hypothetical protein
MPAAMWGRIARPELDFCDLLHGGPTEKRLARFRVQNVVHGPILLQRMSPLLADFVL